MELIEWYPTHFKDKCFATALSDSVEPSMEPSLRQWQTGYELTRVITLHHLNDWTHQSTILRLAISILGRVFWSNTRQNTNDGSKWVCAASPPPAPRFECTGILWHKIDYVVIDIVVAEHVRELLENSLITGADSLPWKHLRLWNRKNLSSIGFDFHIAIASVYRSLTHGNVTKLDKLDDYCKRIHWYKFRNSNHHDHAHSFFWKRFSNTYQIPSNLPCNWMIMVRTWLYFTMKTIQLRSTVSVKWRNKNFLICSTWISKQQAMKLLNQYWVKTSIRKGWQVRNEPSVRAMTQSKLRTWTNKSKFVATPKNNCIQIKISIKLYWQKKFIVKTIVLTFSSGVTFWL